MAFGVRCFLRVVGSSLFVIFVDVRLLLFVCSLVCFDVWLPLLFVKSCLFRVVLCVVCGLLCVVCCLLYVGCWLLAMCCGLL